MDIINIPALLAQGKLLNPADIVVADDMLVISKKLSNTRDGSGYQSFAISIEDLLSLVPVTPPYTEPFKKYVGLLTQTGTSIPAVSELENTITGTATWSRTAVGKYFLTITGAFTDANKVYIPGSIGNNTVSYNIISDGIAVIGYYTIYRYDSNKITLEIYDEIFSNVDLSTLIGTDILALPEIRVYP